MADAENWEGLPNRKSTPRFKKRASYIVKRIKLEIRGVEDLIKALPEDSNMIEPLEARIDKLRDTLDWWTRGW